MASPFSFKPAGTSNPPAFGGFGTQNPAGAAPAANASPFSFGGAAANTTQQQPGGAPATTITPSFSFGAASTPAAKPAAPSLFGGASSASAGSAFGTTTPAGTPAAPAAFSFGAKPTAPSFGGFGNAASAGGASGSAPAAPMPAFSFGPPAAASSPAATPAATTPLNFGQPPAATAASALPSFSFAKPAATPAAPAAGTAPPAVPSTFSFGGAFANANKDNVITSTTPAAKPPAAAFSFGSAKPAAPTFSFATAATTPAATAPAATAPAATAPAATTSAATTTSPTPPATLPSAPLSTAAPLSAAATPNPQSAAPSPASFGGFFSNAAASKADLSKSTDNAASISNTPAATAAPGPFSFQLNKPSTVTPPATSPAATASTTTAAPAAVPAFSFAPKQAVDTSKSATQVNVTAETAKPAPAPAFSFAKSPATTSAASTPAAPTSAQSSATTPVATQSAATPFSFGPKPATPALGVASTPAPAAPTVTVNSSAGASPAGLNTLQTKTTVSVPSLLKGKTLEDIVNGWSTSLDERVREFSNLAAEVKAWDSVLIQNGDEISKLYNSLQALDPVATTITESLDYVESQQKEMSAVLDGYEAQLDEILANRAQQQGGAGSSSGPSEREKAYQLAESLNNQLDDLSRSLSALITEVNSLSPSTSTGMGSDSNAAEQDPVGAVAAILSAHLASLNWIDKTIEGLNSQVSDMEDRMKTASNGKWTGLSSSTRKQVTSGTPGRYGISPSVTPGALQRSAFGGTANRYGTPGRNGTPQRSSQTNVFGLSRR